MELKKASWVFTFHGSARMMRDLTNLLLSSSYPCSNHPFLFEGAETKANGNAEVLRNIVMSSGKMVLLDKLLAKLKADGHRVLIFSQMVRMLDIMSDYMSLRGYIHQRLDGGYPIGGGRKLLSRQS